MIVTWLLSHEDNLARLTPKQHEVILLQCCQRGDIAYIFVSDPGRYGSRVLLCGQLVMVRVLVRTGRSENKALTFSSKLLCTTSRPWEDTLISWSLIISKQWVLDDWPRGEGGRRGGREGRKKGGRERRREGRWGGKGEQRTLSNCNLINCFPYSPLRWCISLACAGFHSVSSPLLTLDTRLPLRVAFSWNKLSFHEVAC